MKALSKKSIRFFLSSMVLISLAAVSGCGDTNNHDVTETTLDTEPAGEKTDAEPVLYEEEKDTVVWKIYYSDYIDIWQGALNRLLEEKGAPYQVKIEAYYAIDEEPSEDAADILERMKQANERADIIAVPSSGYTTMADRDLLLPLDDFLESGQGTAIRNALPARDLARCRYKGITYGISAHLRTVGAVAYDKTLLKKYDIDISELSSDIFENEEALQKIKDGEGGKVIPFAYNDNILYSLGLWKVDPVECLAYTKAGETVNIFETEELREMLFQLKDFKDKGLLQFAAADSVPGSFFAASEMAHREDPFESSSSYINNAGQKITGEYIVIPNMERPQIAPFWGDAQTAVASWSQNREYALDFLTRLYTDPKISNLILYGREGKEYTLEDGVATRLPANMLWVFGEHFTNALIAYPQNDTAVDKMAFQAKYYEQCEPNIPDGFRFDPALVAAEVEATNAVYYAGPETSILSDEVNALFQLNTADIDAALAEINTKLQNAGIDRIIEEFNRQLAEWREKYEK